MGLDVSVRFGPSPHGPDRSVHFGPGQARLILRTFQYRSSPVRTGSVRPDRTGPARPARVHHYYKSDYTGLDVSVRPGPDRSAPIILGPAYVDFQDRPSPTRTADRSSPVQRGLERTGPCTPLLQIRPLGPRALRSGLVRNGPDRSGPARRPVHFGPGQNFGPGGLTT